MSTSQFKYENYDDDFEDNEEKNESQLVPQKQSQVVQVQITTNKQKQSQISSKKIVTDNSTKGKLIEQHIKLKGQLVQLATKMDEILEKQREKKKKKIHGNPTDQDERVIRVKKELQEQANAIQRHKNEIGKLRKNLDNRYDLIKIVEKENQLKHLKKQLNSLESEKESLQKIRKTQDRAVRNEEDKESINKKSRMQEELRELNQKNKERTNEINDKQRQVRRLHQAYRLKEQKIKQIQSKIKQNKMVNGDINEHAITLMEKEIKEIDKERLQIEKEGNENLRYLQRQKKQLKMELERKKLILQEKQKDLRLSQLKHKEIIRLISSSQAGNHSSLAESKVEKENKDQNKRVIAKKGRQAPKIEGDDDDDIIEQNPDSQKNEQKKVEKEKHDYGFSANLDEEVIEDN